MIVKCDNCEKYINTSNDRHLQMGTSWGWSTFYFCSTCSPLVKKELARQQQSAAKRRGSSGACA